MGPGAPYAIAARFAYPDRPVIAFEGDGAFQMNGMNEMITVKRYLDRLGGRPFIFCVFNNAGPEPGHLGAAGDGRRSRGSPARRASRTSRTHRYAELLGLRGIYCEKPDRGRARPGTRRLASDVPVVLEFKTDPEVPPLPPHIMKAQAIEVRQGGAARPAADGPGRARLPAEARRVLREAPRPGQVSDEDAPVTATVPVEDLTVHAFDHPDRRPGRPGAGRHADLVLHHDHPGRGARAGGQTGIGYTYGDVSDRRRWSESKLASAVTGTGRAWPRRRRLAVRCRSSAAQRRAARPRRDGDLGRGHRAVGPEGAAARPAAVPGAARPSGTEVPVYGSGGFTNYPLSGACTEQVSSLGFELGMPADEDQDLPRSRGRPGAAGRRCGRKPATGWSCSPTPTAR